MSTQDPTRTRYEGSISAAFPLALLESVRTHDHPGEVLEDENLSVSLPRRLGLTGVVETQIQRYETALRSRRPVRMDEVMGLIRLVLRRPDCEPILLETGRRAARWHFRSKSGLWTALMHRAPNRLGMRAARRHAVRELKWIYAGSTIEVLKPFTVRVRDCSLAALEEAGHGCPLITGMLEETLLICTGRPKRVVHPRCIRKGGETCVWELSG